MGSVLPKFTSGPRTYNAVEAIAGGQLVEARAGGDDLPGAGVAAANSVKVLGVAQKDATPDGGAPREPVAGVLDVTLAPREFAVISDGFVPDVTYSTAAAYGDRLVVGAAGGVKPWTVEPVTAIIGWCAESGGVAQGATGLTRINL